MTITVEDVHARLQAVEAYLGLDMAQPPIPQGKPLTEWDARLIQRGVRIVQTGGSLLRLIRARYLDEQESAGRHHILVDVLDRQGRRVVDFPVRQYWADGSNTTRTEAKPGEPWAAALPLHAAGHAYGLEVADWRIEGMGLGTIEQPHLGLHVSYEFFFQLVN